MHIRRLSRTGDSAYVVVPPAVRSVLGWRQGDYLTLDVRDGALVVRRLDLPSASAALVHLQAKGLARAARGLVGRRPK